MSYILDALRRADAERQRGAVPGLHAQPVAGLPNAAAAPGASARRLGWAAAALLLLLGAAVAAGWWLRPVAAPAVPVAALTPPALAPGPAALAPPGATLASKAPAALPTPAALPVPMARQPAAPRVSPVLAPAQAGQALPAPVKRPPPGPAALPVPPVALAGQPAKAASAAAAASMFASSPGLTAADAVPARLPRLAELPEAQRRELGALVVGGAMHAEQPALRIVILNGQVLHEGDKLTPELQVQQIRMRSVVLSHRGQRFELPF